MMTDSDHNLLAPARRLWVVLFDSLAMPDPDIDDVSYDEEGHAYLTFNAFDDLEARSVCFEQFVIQNTKSSASECERLGTRSCVANLIQILKAAGYSVATLEIQSELHQASSTDESDSISKVARECGATVIQSPLNTSGDICSQLPGADRMIADRAELLWWRLRDQASVQPTEFRDMALSQILKWHRALPDSDRPVLIVTALWGEARTLEPPLQSGVDEGRIRVPLWIDVGRNHARRVQALAGSFDLVPTIAEFMIGPNNLEHSTALPEVCRPVSLVPLCGLGTLTSAEGSGLSSAVIFIRETFEQRLLPLAGDGWTGLRATQYQLIHRDVSVTDDHDYQPDENRQLFLKPDDLWNVSDAIVTYEAIADEMETRATPC